MKQNKQVNLGDYASFSHSPKRNKPSKKSRFRKWWKHRSTGQKGLLITLVALLTAFLMAVIGTGLWGLITLSMIKRDDDFNNSDEIDLENVIDENIFNVALFGVDAREKGDFEGRSDSIMILSINKITNVVKITSVMRDSLVPYEWNGKKGATKITELYQLGGPVLAVKELNSLFGLDIKEYATVNFFGMADIIDAVGGIDCTVTEDEISRQNTFNINAMIDEYCLYAKLDLADYYVSQTGLQHLNGVQATAYARIRHGRNWNGVNDDFGRTERQRYVMQQLMDKALSMPVSGYPSLAKKLVPYVKTSLSNKQILSLAMMLKNRPTMEQSRIPLDRYIINADFRGTGASTVYYNYEYAGRVLRAYLYDNVLPDDYMTQNGVDLTGWYGVGSKDQKPPATSSTPSSSSQPDDPDDPTGDDPDDPRQDPDVSEPDPSSSEPSSSQDPTASDVSSPQEPADGD